MTPAHRYHQPATFSSYRYFGDVIVRIIVTTFAILAHSLNVISSSTAIAITEIATTWGLYFSFDRRHHTRDPSPFVSTIREYALAHRTSRPSLSSPCYRPLSNRHQAASPSSRHLAVVILARRRCPLAFARSLIAQPRIAPSVVALLQHSTRSRRPCSQSITHCELRPISSAWELVNGVASGQHQIIIWYLLRLSSHFNEVALQRVPRSLPPCHFHH